PCKKFFVLSSTPNPTHPLASFYAFFLRPDNTGIPFLTACGIACGYGQDRRARCRGDCCAIACRCVWGACLQRNVVAHVGNGRCFRRSILSPSRLLETPAFALPMGGVGGCRRYCGR